MSWNLWVVAHMLVIPEPAPVETVNCSTSAMGGGTVVFDPTAGI
jgi:hypothetical protein